MAKKRALFFCSARNDIDPKFNQAARDIVRAACLRGYDIVSGGGNRGTMKVVCEEASACGAGVIGVLPTFMEGLDHPGITNLIWAPSMSVRKELMRAGSEVVITLPGGVGTLDEIAETICLKRLGKYDAKIIIFNYHGFYDTFYKMLEEMIDRKMYSREELEELYFPRTVEEVIELL